MHALRMPHFMTLTEIELSLAPYQTAYFEVIQEHFFREVTFSIFDQRDCHKDDVTMVKKAKYVA